MQFKLKEDRLDNNSNMQSAMRLRIQLLIPTNWIQTVEFSDPEVQHWKFWLCWSIGGKKTLRVVTDPKLELFNKYLQRWYNFAAYLFNHDHAVVFTAVSCVKWTIAFFFFFFFTYNQLENWEVIITLDLYGMCVFGYIVHSVTTQLSPFPPSIRNYILSYLRSMCHLIPIWSIVN